MLVCKNVFVQMDNLVVVEALQCNTGYSMVASPILEDFRKLIGEFGKVLIEHYNKESNMVAHTLAQQGRVDPPTLDSPPSFISGFLADDVSVI